MKLIREWKQSVKLKLQRRENHGLTNSWFINTLKCKFNTLMMQILFSFLSFPFHAHSSFGINFICCVMTKRIKPKRGTKEWCGCSREDDVTLTAIVFLLLKLLFFMIRPANWRTIILLNRFPKKQAAFYSHLIKNRQKNPNNHVDNIFSGFVYNSAHIEHHRTSPTN